MERLTRKDKTGAYFFGLKEIAILLMDRKFKKREVVEIMKFKKERRKDYDILKRCGGVPHSISSGYYEKLYGLEEMK